MYRYVMSSGELMGVFELDHQVETDELVSIVEQSVEYFCTQVSAWPSKLPLFPLLTVTEVEGEDNAIIKMAWAFFLPQLLDKAGKQEWADQLRSDMKRIIPDLPDDKVFSSPITEEDMTYLSKSIAKNFPKTTNAFMSAFIENTFLDGITNVEVRDIYREIIYTLIHSGSREESKNTLVARFGLTEVEAARLLSSKGNDTAVAIREIFGITS